jgi:hypothetical protein
MPGAKAKLEHFVSLIAKQDFIGHAMTSLPFSADLQDVMFSSFKTTSSLHHQFGVADTITIALALQQTTILIT